MSTENSEYELREVSLWSGSREGGNKERNFVTGDQTRTLIKSRNGKGKEICFGGQEPHNIAKSPSGLMAPRSSHEHL